MKGTVLVFRGAQAFPTGSTDEVRVRARAGRRRRSDLEPRAFVGAGARFDRRPAGARPRGDRRRRRLDRRRGDAGRELRTAGPPSAVGASGGRCRAQRRLAGGARPPRGVSRFGRSLASGQARTAAGATRFAKRAGRVLRRFSNRDDRRQRACGWARRLGRRTARGLRAGGGGSPARGRTPARRPVGSGDARHHR